MPDRSDAGDPSGKSWLNGATTQSEHAKIEAQTAAPGAQGPNSQASQAGAHGPAPAPRASETFPAAASAQTPSRQVDIIRQYELVDLVKAYHPAVDEERLNRAYVFAMKAHGDQLRKSGDPYFTHPLAVAELLTELHADPATVATALLHDVVEDTSATIDDIRRLFGEEIAHLVDGVTKLSKFEMQKIPGFYDEALSKPNKAVEQFEQFRKFVVHMADDVRVLLVKLADRLHNMRTLHFFDNKEKRERIAQETLEVYAPLAGRIGVHRFREELEDLAFAELNPIAYAPIRDKLQALSGSAAIKVAQLGADLRENLRRAGVTAEVTSREKKPYSIWRKMTRKNVGFEQLADIYAFRVIVNKIEDCYRALGVIHGLWRVAPEEFDDYISSPKPNGYRSIHTAVVGPPRPGGEHQRIEIQIRTREMHELAERGVAAHWQYKNAIYTGGSPDDLFPRAQYDPYETPRRLAEMLEQQGDDPEQALRFAKFELFHDQVFCFTPKGQMISLPIGATTIDFAYAVHTTLGDQYVGAEINGVNLPARTPLKNGDIVKILASENAQVRPEWEALAVTGKAQTAIRKRVRRLKHEDKIELGRKKAEAVFAHAHLDFSPRAIKAALKRLKEKSIEEVLFKVGDGVINVNELVKAAYPGAIVETEGEIRPGARKKFNARAAIIGLPAGAKTRIAQCCAPVPGERILGVIEDDGDVAVHTIYCETWARLDPPESSLIDLHWDKETEAVFGFTQVLVTVRNEIGVLSEVAACIARYGVSIANIKMRNQSPEFVDLYIDVEVKNERQLAQMLAGLKTVSNVVSADRRESLDHE
jgi:GTP pyrophosphokinase